jgi:hypothetical protein
MVRRYALNHIGAEIDSPKLPRGTSRHGLGYSYFFGHAAHNPTTRPMTRG